MKPTKAKKKIQKRFKSIDRITETPKETFKYKSAISSKVMIIILEAIKKTIPTWAM